MGGSSHIISMLTTVNVFLIMGIMVFNNNHKPGDNLQWYFTWHIQKLSLLGFKFFNLVDLIHLTPKAAIL